jgi:hypothetical protein
VTRCITYQGNALIIIIIIIWSVFSIYIYTHAQYGTWMQTQKKVMNGIMFKTNRNEYNIMYKIKVSFSYSSFLEIERNHTTHNWSRARPRSLMHYMHVSIPWTTRLRNKTKKKRSYNIASEHKKKRTEETYDVTRGIMTKEKKRIVKINCHDRKRFRIYGYI